MSGFKKRSPAMPNTAPIICSRPSKPDGSAPTNWQSKFGGSAWEYAPQIGQYYLHLFDVTQADLDWTNPDVRAEIADIVRFWQEKGVHGFRFDVINLISKREFADDPNHADGRQFYTDGRACTNTCAS